ncbi:MAG: hypothetical protein FJ034_05925 [Chloroflexi bacterium]|nr:hypothetical protein [Chloroflexota bacterium]
MNSRSTTQLVGPRAARGRTPWTVAILRQFLAGLALCSLALPLLLVFAGGAAPHATPATAIAPRGAELPTLDMVTGSADTEALAIAETNDPAGAEDDESDDGPFVAVAAGVHRAPSDARRASVRPHAVLEARHRPRVVARASAPRGPPA